MTDIIIIATVVVLAALIVFYLIRQKKKGRKCIGCPENGSCSACTCRHK